MALLANGEEIFIPIYEALCRYEISNLGRVKSWYFQGKKREVPKFLKHGFTHGYPCVVLVVNGHRRTYMIHRLLAMYFISNPKRYPEVNHIDGDRSNYSISNLEWVTHRQNTIHAIEVLDRRNGCKSNLSIFNANQLAEIYKLRFVEKWTARKIAEVYNCSEATIINFCAGRRYKKEYKRLKIN